MDPVVLAVTAYEGGTWVPWEEWKKIRAPDYKGKRVHAVLWSDGRVWDAVNGFRTGGPAPMTISEIVRLWEEYKTARVRVKAMRLEPEIFGEV